MHVLNQCKQAQTRSQSKLDLTLKKFCFIIILANISKQHCPKSFNNIYSYQQSLETNKNWTLKKLAKSVNLLWQKMRMCGGVYCISLSIC